MNQATPPDWQTNHFDERQRALIHNCQTYAQDNPAGVPGHNLMLIIAKMSTLLTKYETLTYITLIDEQSQS